MAKLESSTLSDVSSPTRMVSISSGSERPAAPGNTPASPTEPAPRIPTDHDLAESGEEADVTRRLRAQYAEISQLAGGLAHEIRNPLSTVQMNLDLMAEDFEASETPRDRRVLERIQRLRHEVHRLHGILENFLRFACVQDLKFDAVDLNEIVEELRDFYEPLATTKSIVMRTQLATDLPLIGLDTDLFKQALLNLILNAEHAMPSGGELILKTRVEGRSIVLDVTDTGVGIQDAVRARIFEAFFSTRASGSGLGLPTTRKIVEAHGGTIHVQSEPGKGSQFTIRLPAGPPASSTADGNAILDDRSSSRPSRRG